MISDGPPLRALNLLLMSGDPAWRDATDAAVSTLGSGQTEVLDDPSEALRKLIAANGAYTHFLFEVSRAPAWLDMFTGLTTGETGSGTALIRLGVDSGETIETPAIRYPDGAVLAGTLAASAPGVAGTPQQPLSNTEIVGALEDGHIHCRFQPIVRMSDRRPVGLEILARLAHPVRGTLPPGLFIPQMEQAGLSVNLTEAVFKCCLSLINAAFLETEDLFLSINLPLDALLLPEALARIDDRRKEAGIPAGRMLIELTESRPVHDLPVLAAALDRWRAIGYRLAIDDLGPDVVNQTSLVDMQFQTIKLDKQVVLRSRTDPLARSYLQRTVANARARSLAVIAEGIEDQFMWDRMAEIGVDQAQGFLIARALPAAALPVWLDVWGDKAKRA